MMTSSLTMKRELKDLQESYDALVKESGKMQAEIDDREVIITKLEDCVVELKGELSDTVGTRDALAEHLKVTKAANFKMSNEIEELKDDITGLHESIVELQGKLDKAELKVCCECGGETITRPPGDWDIDTDDDGNVIWRCGACLGVDRVVEQNKTFSKVLLEHHQRSEPQVLSRATVSTREGWTCPICKRSVSPDLGTCPDVSHEVV